MRVLGLTTFDRYLIRQFLVSYLICFVSLVSLYVVIDAFTNFDEFSEVASGIGELIQVMATYYGCRITLIFDRLAGVITLLAAMFVLGWLRRHNELVPFLSAGITTWRVIGAVILGAIFVNSLMVANQELVIPAIGERLLWSPDDPDGTKAETAEGAYDSNGVLVAGKSVDRGRSTLHRVTLVLPRHVAGRLLTVYAERAIYQQPARSGEPGRWILVQPDPPEIPELPGILVKGERNGTYVLYSDVSLRDVIAGENWMYLEPTRNLLAKLAQGDIPRRAEMETLVHRRLTRPLLNIVMLFLGLPLVLGAENRRIFWNLGLCLALSCTLHGIDYAAQTLAAHELISPPLAAWTPVLLFGPIAAALHDFVQT